MVKQLLITRLERNQASLSFYTILSILAICLFCFANRQEMSINTLYLAFATFSFLLYLVIGSVVLKNDNREKRIRLYSQLPVSNSQVRISSWLFISTCLLIPSLIFLLSMIYIGQLSFLQLSLYTLLFFFHGIVLISLIFIALQPMTLLTNVDKRFVKPLIPISFFVLSLFGFFFILGGDIFILNNTKINWSLLFLLFIIPGVFFVSLDLHLYHRSDNYLG